MDSVVHVITAECWLTHDTHNIFRSVCTVYDMRMNVFDYLYKILNTNIKAKNCIIHVNQLCLVKCTKLNPNTFSYAPMYLHVN